MFEIDGYIIILQHVQCIYPVEKTDTGYSFGFKYSNGFWESFTFKTKKEADKIRKSMIEAIHIELNRTQSVTF